MDWHDTRANRVSGPRVPPGFMAKARGEESPRGGTRPWVRTSPIRCRSAGQAHMTRPLRALTGLQPLAWLRLNRFKTEDTEIVVESRACTPSRLSRSPVPPHDRSNPARYRVGDYRILRAPLTLASTGIQSTPVPYPFTMPYTSPRSYVHRAFLRRSAHSLPPPALPTTPRAAISRHNFACVTHLAQRLP